MNDFSLPPEAASILVALGAGLLIGVERERRSSEEQVPGAAGVRTFALTALLGVFATLTGSQVALGGVALGVVALTALSYTRTRARDPGLTTEIALLATFIVGVLAAGHPLLAAAAGVLILVLLVSRSWLHDFARARLSEHELQDAVLLAAAAILVLPLLPDHPLDPWGVVNPRLVWKLTVVIMLVDGAGYVAQRLIGARAGLPLSGLLGGFVSSTAVVATMGKRARSEPGICPAAAAGAAFSQIATASQLALVLAVSDAALLRSLTWPLLAMGVVASAYGVLLLLVSKDHAAPPPSSGRAFRLRTAFGFAAAFTVVALLVAWLQRSFGTTWALAGVVAGGFADAHSTAASVGSLTAAGRLTPELAGIAIGLVVTTNTLSKLGFAWAGGGRYFARLAPGLVLLVAAYWVTWFVV